MEFENKSSSCSVEKKSKKQKKQPPWDEKDVTLIIIEVLEREHALFGDIKGSGAKSIHRKRQECWQEVVDIIQSYGFFF